MESGEFSRGRESIRAEGGIVMVGNFDVDVWTQLRSGHLLAPLPKEMRNDTAFMDRIHAYLPGWDVPKLNPGHFSSHFGFVSDFLAECWSLLRRTSRLDVIEGRVRWGRALSGRDRRAANNTVDGLLRLLYPDPDMEVSDEELAWAVELSLELRRRVKEQQAFVGRAEFGNVDLSYELGGRGEKVVFCQETVGHSLGEGGERDQPGPEEPEETASRDSLPAPDPVELETSSDTRSHEYGPGEVIGGRFEVIEELGAGGFSHVYRVTDSVEGVERALKLFDNAAGYDAVRREVAALRKIHHPHVLEVIWADKTDEGEWYLISEFVDGESLEAYATGEKHLRDREAVDVALDVLDALAAIHPDAVRLAELADKQKEGDLTETEFSELQGIKEEGIVHRDIKPQNIMLTRSGAKVLDFNIASRVGDPVETVSGTPPYQAPDADYTSWDVSTDLFAVGVTRYELLCGGEHPYPSGTPSMVEKVRNPRSLRPDLSQELADFLVRACDSDRSNRFQTATEMHSALKSVRERT